MTAPAAARPSPARRPLREWASPAPAGARLRVDRDAGVIYGVKVLGFRSRNSHGFEGAVNGTEYTRACLQAALPLYEGADVLVDHDPGPHPRGPADVFGKLRGVRLGADGLRADLHFLASHPLAGRVCEDVERGLGVYGLSHDASAGRERFDPATRRLVIESLSAVRSVDLVRKPATNRNLWEGGWSVPPAAPGRRRSRPAAEIAALRRRLAEWDRRHVAFATSREFAAAVLGREGLSPLPPWPFLAAVTDRSPPGAAESFARSIRGDD